MELPSHPEADDSAPDHEPATTASRATVVVAVVLALVALIVILHLTGAVGPTAH